MAKATLIHPIKSLHGTLAKDNRFYIRTLNGKTIIQRKPDRSKHIPTEKEKQNQERFKHTYVKKSKKHLPHSNHIRDHLATTSGPLYRNEIEKR